MSNKSKRNQQAQSNRRSIFAIVAFILLLTAAYIGYVVLSETYGESTLDTTTTSSAIGQPVPNFTVTDVSGKSVSLKDFLGKPVVINFWASWCPPCKGEMPYFQKAYETYGSEITFLMVDLTDGTRETEAAARRYIAEQGYTFPFYFDHQSRTASSWGIASIPSSYFVDQDGNLAALQIGALTEAQLEAAIGKIR